MAKVLEPVKWLGVVGDPVVQSLSPDIFEFVGRKLADRVNSRLCYKALSVAKKDVSDLIELNKRLGIMLGFNVTIPHKETVIHHLDWLSPEAKTLGAANVVHFQSLTHNSWSARGYNTDVFGISMTLKEHGEFKKKKGTAVIFGAGGAARAVAFVLGQAEFSEVFIVNRSESRAEKMRHDFSCQFPKCQWRVVGVNDLPREVSLYVNATSVGMEGADQVELLPKELCKKALAFDLVYRPVTTAFLKSAESRNLRTVGGLDMLIWQALASLEIWLGRVEKRDKLKKQLHSHLRKIIGRKR